MDILRGAGILVLLFSLSALFVVIARPGNERFLRLEYAGAPSGMVFVPPGDFKMGSDDPNADLDEKPMRSLFLKGFYIDEYEVTHRDFKAFDREHTFLASEAELPVTGVTLVRARAYAAFVGKRLPTTAEWEKAARGTDGRAYTWGNEFVPGLANIGGGEGLKPVGSYPESVSPYGAHDMIGNAWEWVEGDYISRGLFGKKLYTTEIIKGGAYSYSPYQGRASYNGFEGNGGTCNDVGFRCALDAEPIR